MGSRTITHAIVAFLANTQGGIAVVVGGSRNGKAGGAEGRKENGGDVHFAI